MPVDTSIAMGVRPIELENPLNQFAKITAIQHAQNQNALAQYQMSSAQRNDEVQNSLLRDLRAAGPDEAKQGQAYLNAGKADVWTKLQQEKANTEKAKADTRKTDADAVTTMHQNFNNTYSPVAAAAAGPEGVAQYIRAMYAHPVLGPMASAVKPLDQNIEDSVKLFNQDPKQWVTAHANLKGDDILNSMKGTRQNVSTGGANVGSTVDAYGRVVPGSTVSTPITQSADNAATVAESIRHHGVIERQGAEANKAPVMTTVVDPTNPEQMISVDARRYKGGGFGSAGVLGVSGKEPGAALRKNKLEEGRSSVLDTVDTLRAEYNALHAAGDMPSTGAGVASNALSSVTVIPGGQAVARFVGTEAQSHRDVIKSLKLQLLIAIKSATGMSAQQLNSNVELKTWLDAVSDPYQAKEAVDKILDKIENKYGKGIAVPSRSAAGPIKGGPALPSGFKRD